MGEPRQRPPSANQRAPRGAARARDVHGRSGEIPPGRQSHFGGLVSFPSRARPPPPLESSFPSPPAAAGSSLLGSGCATSLPFCTAATSANPRDLFSSTLCPSFSSALRVLG